MKNATLRLFLIFVLLLIQTTALSQNEKNFADAKFWVKGGENENQSNFGDYSDESEHLIPAKVDSRFDDDFLG